MRSPSIHSWFELIDRCWLFAIGVTVTSSGKANLSGGDGSVTCRTFPDMKLWLELRLIVEVV